MIELIGQIGIVLIGLIGIILNVQIGIVQCTFVFLSFTSVTHIRFSKTLRLAKFTKQLWTDYTDLLIERFLWSLSFSSVIKLLNSIHFTEGKLETCQPMITLIGMIVVVIIRLTFGHFSNNQFTQGFLHILVTCQYKFTAAWNFRFHNSWK